MTTDDELEAKIMAAVEGYAEEDVFAALFTLAAKMVVVAANGDVLEVSKIFRDTADHWDLACRGAHH